MSASLVPDKPTQPRAAAGLSRVSLSLGEAVIGHGRDGEEWVIYGLGSCVGLILADPRNRRAAMAHIVLPQSPTAHPLQPAKYANTGIAYLLSGLKRLGSVQSALIAYVVGGARMLQLKSFGDIGERNVERVQQSLADLGIPIVGQDVGGTSGRTLRWDNGKGVATVTRVGNDPLILTDSRFRYVTSSLGLKITENDCARGSLGAQGLD